MGMLLRHRRETETLTTTEDLMGKPEKAEKTENKVSESVKGTKPKTVKRGRPTKQ